MYRHHFLFTLFLTFISLFTDEPSLNNHYTSKSIYASKSIHASKSIGKSIGIKMAKRKTNKRRRLSTESKQRETPNESSVTGESQNLSKVLSLKELTQEYRIQCINELCNSQAWMICKGNQSETESPTYLDYMLQDCKEWPSLELISETLFKLPADINLELFIRNKCARNQLLTILSCASKNTMLHEITKGLKSNSIDNLPLLEKHSDELILSYVQYKSK